MTYFNIAIIITLVLFDLLALKFVWIILSSKRISQLEAAVTSFALIFATVGMTFTSINPVIAPEPEAKSPVPVYHSESVTRPYTSRNHQSRLHSTSSRAKPKLIHNPMKR